MSGDSERTMFIPTRLAVTLHFTSSETLLSPIQRRGRRSEVLPGIWALPRVGYCWKRSEGCPKTIAEGGECVAGGGYFVAGRLVQSWEPWTNLRIDKRTKTPSLIPNSCGAPHKHYGRIALHLRL